MPDISIMGTPLPLSYEGMDADTHMVDAIRLGKSLAGTGKLYRSALSFYYEGRVSQNMAGSELRILVGPPEPGSLSYMIWVMMQHGVLPLYPQLLAEVVDLVVPDLIKGMIGKRSGQQKMVDDSVDKLHEITLANTALANRFADLSETVVADARNDKDRLFDVIDTLSQKNATAMREMVDPVGRSVKQITHFKSTPAELTIDEPAAHAIRKEDMEVKDEVEIKVQLGMVDRITRTCKIESPEYPKPIRGKITDPALEEPHNVYTHALDGKSEVIITGKPVEKDGEIHTFYISNAKPVPD